MSDCPDSVRNYRKKSCPLFVCLSGRTRTRQSCPNFHCSCPPTSDSMLETALNNAINNRLSSKLSMENEHTTICLVVF